MKRLSFVSDSIHDAERLRHQLAGILDVRFIELKHVADEEPDHFTLVATNFRDIPTLLSLKRWIQSKPKDSKVLFATRADSRLESAQAFALGATDVVRRPIEIKELLRKLWNDFTVLAGDSTTFERQGHPGVARAQDSLQAIFAAACSGKTPDPEIIESASAAIVDEIESKGLAGWIEIVRSHHSQTYQHCLLVTGIAVSFGQHLGLGPADCRRLSFAGLLHDVGKARIPLAILEKTSPLNMDESSIMKKHAEFGADVLNGDNSLHPEMLDIVVHHHEYLDGSGYPHGLRASEISDLVRIVTISDVFGALIEQRPYKPPLSIQQAHDILLGMGPKLDKDLVREFGFVTKAAA
jgi:putative nucleotidyltransferase with HDIG domain